MPAYYDPAIPVPCRVVGQTFVSERVLNQATRDAVLCPDSDITCVLVRCADGSECWMAIHDYSANPEIGSYVVTEQRKRVSMETNAGGCVPEDSWVWRAFHARG